MGDSTVSPGYNLLKIRPIRKLILWSLFPYLFQAIFLLIFVLLAVTGWRLYAPEGVASKLYAKANIVNLVIWGLWWPVMIWVAVLFGRLWCTVCPLELVANGTERLGRALGIKQLSLGKALSSGALIAALYLLIQMLVPGIELHRVPAYTSIFLWTLIAIAGVTGFLIKDRAFCRGFCPVGLLLGTYGRGSMLAVRPRSGETFGASEDKPCITPSDRPDSNSRICPSLLNPPKLNGSKDCLMCGQCIKSYGPDNMQLLLRRPFHPSDTREPMANWPLVFFIFVVSGFVTYELCSEWKAAQAVFLAIPTAVTNVLSLPDYLGWIKGAWTLLVFPALLWLALGSAIRLLGGSASLSEAFRRMALPFAVILAAGHMAKALGKISSWGGYFPFVLKEPLGIETVQALSSKAIQTPAHLIPKVWVASIGVGLLLLGMYFAINEIKRSLKTKPMPIVIPLGLAALIYVFIVVGWGL